MSLLGKPSFKVSVVWCTLGVVFLFYHLYAHARIYAPRLSFSPSYSIPLCHAMSSKSKPSLSRILGLSEFAGLALASIIRIAHPVLRNAQIASQPKNQKIGMYVKTNLGYAKYIQSIWREREYATNEKSCNILLYPNHQNKTR